MKSRILPVVTMIALFVSAAFVSARADEAKKTGPCSADIEKFCQGIQPGDGRIVACLKSHETELSSACQERRAEIKKMVKEVSEACKGDVEEFCSGVKPGEGRIRHCLHDNKDKLSSGCKETIKEVHAQKKAGQ